MIAASPRTDLANPNVIRASAGTIFALPLAAAADGRGDRLAARARDPHRRGHASMRSGSTPTPISPARSRIASRQRGRRPHRCLDGLGHRGRPTADARHRRQPERVGRGRGPAVRGAPATRPSRRSRTTDADGCHLRLRHHRRRPRRRGRRLQGPRAAALGRDRRSPLVRRQLPAHRLPAVEVAAPRRGRASRRTRRRYDVAAGIGPSRLHDQPRRRRRRAGRLAATSTRSRSRRGGLPRRGAHHRPRPRRGHATTARATSSRRRTS